VPKTSDGAISHRVSQLQLWYVRVVLLTCSEKTNKKRVLPRRSDSVYMVPPFLAYYGLTTNNQSMLQEAYTQVRVLKDSIPPIGSNVRRVTWWTHKKRK